MGKDQSNRRTSQSAKPLKPLSFAKVILETSVPHLDREFDYAIPDSLLTAVQIGSRVQVPFGKQKVNGWVVEKFSKSDYQSKIAYILKIIGLIPTLRPEILSLAQIVSQYYLGTLSDVLRFAIPPRHAQVEKEFINQLTHSLGREKTILKGENEPKYLLLKTTENWQDVIWSTIENFHNEGKKVLVVVPEHEQINQILMTSKNKGSKLQVAVLSAESTAAHRYENFLKIYFGQADLVIGTRNSIFAPMLGAFSIIVFQEHSDIYQSPQAPYWQVATVAELRAENENCELLYLGYGISLQKYKDITEAKVNLCENSKAPIRVSQVLNDLNSKLAATDDYSATLWQALAESKFGPVLVQVPRKGLANLLQCGNCFRVLTCNNCSGLLKLLDNSSVPHCLRCANLETKVSCSTCESKRYRILQSGQAGVVKLIGSRLPGINIYSSTKEKRVSHVDQNPSITVCTPGAAPISTGGYRAIIILNAMSQLAVPRLEIYQEVFNQWLILQAQLKNHPQAKFVIHGEIDDNFFKFFKSEKVIEFTKHEYQQRIQADLPPEFHSVIYRGNLKQLALATKDTASKNQIKILGPVADPEKTDLFRTALLSKDLNSLRELAFAISRGSILRGTDTLQIKVDSIDFI